jgi:hypothetical protein
MAVSLAFLILLAMNSLKLEGGMKTEKIDTGSLKLLGQALCGTFRVEAYQQVPPRTRLLQLPFVVKTQIGITENSETLLPSTLSGYLEAISCRNGNAYFLMSQRKKNGYSFPIYRFEKDHLEHFSDAPSIYRGGIHFTEDSVAFLYGGNGAYSLDGGVTWQEPPRPHQLPLAEGSAVAADTLYIWRGSAITALRADELASGRGAREEAVPLPEGKIKEIVCAKDGMSAYALIDTGSEVVAHGLNKGAPLDGVTVLKRSGDEADLAGTLVSDSAFFFFFTAWKSPVQRQNVVAATPERVIEKKLWISGVVPVRIDGLTAYYSGDKFLMEGHEVLKASIE